MFPTPSRGYANNGVDEVNHRSAVLDTTFLISLADGKRPSHAAAHDYYRHFVSNNVTMFLPTVVVAEFGVKQPIDALPLHNFRVLPFNLPHALLCAALNVAANRAAIGQIGQRDAVKDDFKIIAQAQAEKADFLLTDDVETMGAYCARLAADGKTTFKVVQLREGFDVAFVNGTGQSELPM
jgi:hypothetical protein